MQTIIPPSPLAARILNVQKKHPNEAYRLLTYCEQSPVTEGLLLYNNLTLEMLLLSPEEAAKLTELDPLIDRWFLVPEHQNDSLLADQVHDIATLLTSANQTRIHSYTIFTTTYCNARCPYCFEQDVARKHMTLDTAQHVARYILQNYGEKPVHLNWFGGEPLMNQAVMDAICEALSKAGIVYRSWLISNGYLLNQEVIRKAVNLWHLKRVQITLDGTENVYNRTKAYIHPTGSPFQRVLQNINLLLDAKIRVIIRLNVGLENWQDLLVLTDDLAKRLKGRKGLHVYPSPLEEEVIAKDGKRQWMQTKNDLLMEKCREIQNHLLELGLSQPKHLPRDFRTTNCMADNEGAVTITPDGSLGRCEHFADSEIFGHIDSENRDEAVIASWKEYLPFKPECPNCLSYPQCRILKKCPGKTVCTIENDVDLRAHLRDQMRYEYEFFLKKQPPAEDGEPTPENC